MQTIAVPPRCEHAPQLGDEVIERLDVLDHLVRMHDVESSVGKRPTLFEIAGTHVEAAPPGSLRAGVHELEAVDMVGRDTDPAAHLVGPRAVVATDIKHEGRRISI